MRTDLDVVKFLSLAVLAACGGTGLTSQRPLAPTDERPTKELCILAVVNYDRVEALVLGGPGAGGRASENRALDRQRRVGECVSQMTAREATCMSDAQSLSEAQACASTITW